METKEVARKELFKGSGIYCVTVEHKAFKIVTNGLCSMQFGPYETENDAKMASANLPDSLIAPYMHRFTYYERFGKRVF